MTNHVYLLGKAKWVKIKKPDEKFNKYGLDLYPTEGSWVAFDKTGIQVKKREDQEGERFIKLSRPVSKVRRDEIEQMGPPELLIRRRDEDGNVVEGYDKFDGEVGNGSLVRCKVSYYPTRNGIGHTLESIAVEDLVEYNPTVNSGEFEMPF